jgi:hypothetical protein
MSECKTIRLCQLTTVEQEAGVSVPMTPELVNALESLLEHGHVSESADADQWLRYKRAVGLVRATLDTLTGAGDGSQ